MTFGSSVNQTLPHAGETTGAVARASRVDDVTRDEVIDLCLDMPGAIEDYPFGDEVAVFKVEGKMFALVPLSGGQGSVTKSARRGCWRAGPIRRHSSRPGEVS